MEISKSPLEKIFISEIESFISTKHANPYYLDLMRMYWPIFHPNTHVQTIQDHIEIGGYIFELIYDDKLWFNQDCS